MSNRNQRARQVSGGNGRLTRRTLERLEARCVLSASANSPLHVPLPALNDSHEPGDGMVAVVSRDAARDMNVSRTPSGFDGGYAKPAHNGVGGMWIAEPQMFAATGYSAWSVRIVEGDFYGMHVTVITLVPRGNEGQSFGYSERGSVENYGAYGSHSDMGFVEASYGKQPEAPSHYLLAPEAPAGAFAVPTSATEQATSPAAPTMVAAAHPAAVSSVTAAIQAIPSMVRVAPLAYDRLAVHSTSWANELNPWVKMVDSASGADDARIAASEKSARADTTDAFFSSTPMVTSPASEAAIVSVDRASLAGIPLDLHGVERALQTVVSEIDALRVELTEWLDDSPFTPMIVAIAAASAGAGAAYYRRRRGASEIEQPDDRASSSWLFARLQPVPVER